MLFRLIYTGLALRVSVSATAAMLISAAYRVGAKEHIYVHG
jgi:hypothetical protein